MNGNSISTAATLPALAAAINAEHRQAETALNDGLRHALEAGRLLLEAKKLCPHGTWAQWLKDNFRGSARTARAYTLAAKRFPRLEAKRQRAANLSLRQVALLTTAPKQKDPLKIVQRVLRMLPPVSELTTIGEVKSARDIALEALRIATAEKFDAERNLGLALKDREAPRLTAAPKATREPATDQGQGKRFLDAPLDVRQKTCRQWWDILASHALMLDAAGWEPAKIAETLAVETSEIHAILNPRPPQYNFANYNHPEAMARCYADAVAEQLANQLRWTYWKAQHTAQREGFPEVIPLLQAMEAKQQRLRASLDGSVDAIVTATQDNAKTADEKRVWPVAMYCCITDDIREALGVAPRKFPWTMFLLHFVEWCRVVERNATDKPTEQQQEPSADE